MSFIVEADDDEETADELLRQAWEAVSHPEKRCQIEMHREPGGWSVHVQRVRVGKIEKAWADADAEELGKHLEKLDRRGKKR